MIHFRHKLEKESKTKVLQVPMIVTMRRLLYYSAVPIYVSQDLCINKRTRNAPVRDLSKLTVRMYSDIN